MTDRQAWSRLWLAAAFALLPFAARAELAVSANDNKAVLENGVIATVLNAEPDTVSIIDLSASPPKILIEIPAPASVVGPPGSVAIAPDESFALVTGGMKLDPNDPKKMVPDDKARRSTLKPCRPRWCKPSRLEGGGRDLRQSDGNARARRQPQRRNGVGLHDRRWQAQGGW